MRQALALSIGCRSLKRLNLGVRLIVFPCVVNWDLSAVVRLLGMAREPMMMQDTVLVHAAVAAGVRALSRPAALGHAWTLESPR